MTVQEFWNGGIQFLNLCAVYYVMQLVRCVLFSYAVFAFIFILRKTALKNKAFLKGALWSLLFPVLFIGKMTFFYENRIGVLLFSGLTKLCMSHIWICWLYLCGIFLYATRLFCRKRKLKKLVAGMQKRKVEDTPVYVAKAPVTPSAIGLFRPKIVMPEVMLKEYDREEIQMILLHEKTHIRLGHLLCYFLWDVLRVLLWGNPFLSAGTKYVREDMEEICDLVTIRRSKGKAYAYGQLLLKSMKLLQTESEEFHMHAAFVGDNEYQSVRQRVKRIAGYQPYQRTVAVGTWIAAMLCMLGAVVWIWHVSYGRCNPIDSMAVYDMGTGTELFGDRDALREAVSYDENYIYIKAEAFQELIWNSTVSSEDICFYCGRYYKLPGIGGGGGCGYLGKAELENGIWKIKNVKHEDIFERILKIL